MQTKLFLFLLCSASLNAFAQTFTLAHILSDNEKTFKPGGFYEIILGENGEVQKSDCCDWLNLTGRLSSVTADSFQLELKSYERKMIVDNLEITHGIYASENSNFGSFSKEDIFGLKYYKSEKSKKRKDAFTIIGGILMFTAAATAMNTFIISDKDDRATLWKSAGIQAGGSITFLILQSSKKYKLKGKDREWQLR